MGRRRERLKEGREKKFKKLFHVTQRPHSANSCQLLAHRSLSQAYHRYALNYINALNYLESLRRHHDFCEFEKVSLIRLSFF